jgi:Tfp pilus assembly protein PilF
MSAAQYDVAKVLLKKCVEEAVYYSSCIINLAIVSAATGDDATAEESFKKGIEIDRGLLNSRIFYVDFLIRRGRDAEAKRYLEEANNFASGLNKSIVDRLDSVNARLLGKK